MRPLVARALAASSCHRLVSDVLACPEWGHEQVRMLGTAVWDPVDQEFVVTVVDRGVAICTGCQGIAHEEPAFLHTGQVFAAIEEAAAAQIAARPVGPPVRYCCMLCQSPDFSYQVTVSQDPLLDRFDIVSLDPSEATCMGCGIHGLGPMSVLVPAAERKALVKQREDRRKERSTDLQQIKRLRAFVGR